MSRMALKAVTARTPEREALAIRIDEHRALSEELAATTRALENWEQRAALRKKVDDAKVAVETAKQNAARHLTDTAMGKAGAPPQTVRAARDALQDAEDELEAALSVETSLEQQKREMRDRLSRAKIGLDEAFRRAAAADNAVKLVFSRYKALQRQLAGHRRLVAALSSSGAVPEEQKHWDSTNPDDAEDTSAAIAEWERALAALRVDPDASLPEG